MRIPKKIRDEIKEFCKLNGIEDIDDFILKNIKTGFNIEKYGNAPFTKEVVVEKEVPVEVIKEVVVDKEIPVEIIKEVLVEVPVEKEVIKEITIEKDVYITDDKQVNELGVKIGKLEDIINQKEKNFWPHSQGLLVLSFKGLISISTQSYFVISRQVTVKSKSF